MTSHALKALATAGPPLAGRARRRLLHERGFTMIELLVAIMMLSVGLLGAAMALDSSRRLTVSSENKQAAAHVAQQDLERLLAGGYASIATNAAPAASTNPGDPRYYVYASGASGCPASASSCYQWDQSAPASSATVAPLVINASGTTAPGPISWSAGGLTGSLYRFITSIDDPCTSCSSSADQAITSDYKRITVAVTVTGSARKPLLFSAVATDPNARKGS